MPRPESPVSHRTTPVTRLLQPSAAGDGWSPALVQDLLLGTASRQGGCIALRVRDTVLPYGQLSELVTATARGLLAHGLQPRDRVAVYLPKTVESVAALFGTALAGGVFVPVNPVLKSPQVSHILRDSGARMLVTSMGRLAALTEGVQQPELEWPELECVILTDTGADTAANPATNTGRGKAPVTLRWSELCAETTIPGLERRCADTDLAALFYTSGSTGSPKGVMLSHRNLVAGAVSVASYLGNDANDRILAVLPLSFDAGFSQLTTGFLAGAQVTLLDYLLARDVVRTVAEHRITGITAVPPLWIPLAELDWPPEVGRSMRFFASTGGAMPRSVLGKLRQAMPSAAPFLMYGLTEAFRSTYLPPAEVDRRPDSIGKAIPNAEILVLRDDGTPCNTGEPGELVHRGPTVALGYWNAPELSARRFRPIPGAGHTGVTPELAVWSGDTVVSDEDGFLYFRGRRDEMLKSSGYRISPTEIEEQVVSSGLVREAVAIGLPDPRLGEAVVVIAVPRDAGATPTAALVKHCQERMPLYMVPARVEWRSSLPRNANGKYDRLALRTELLADPATA